MTRTWLTRLLLIAPLVASASAGFAQTAPPPAPEPMPPAVAPLAPTSGTPATNPKPAAQTAATDKPAMSPDAGAAIKPPRLAPALHPATAAAPPRPVARPATLNAPRTGTGGAFGTAAAARARPIAAPGTVAKPAAPLGAAGPGAAPIARPVLAPRPTPALRSKPGATLVGAAVAAPKPAGALAPRPAGTAPLAKPATAASVAVAALAAPAFKPAPELEQLKFLRGRWRCDGKQFASPLFGPEHTFTAIAEGKPMVDGFWDQYTYEERRSKDHHGLKVQGQWGWDQGAKHLVRVAVTNAGDWDSGSAPGLEGDKIVWTGEFSGLLGRMAYRHTFTKKSDKEWTHALELKDPTGKFTPTNEVTCKR